MSYTVLKSAFTAFLFASGLVLTVSGCYTVVDDGVSKPKTTRPDRPPQVYDYGNRGRTIVGRVQRNERGHTHRAPSYLVIEDSRRNRYTITYDGGQGVRCDFMSSTVSRISPGTRVEAYVKCQGYNCTVCEGGGDYYIRRVGGRR